MAADAGVQTDHEAEFLGGAGGQFSHLPTFHLEFFGPALHGDLMGSN
jgi:hypothetical protein